MKNILHSLAALVVVAAGIAGASPAFTAVDGTDTVAILFAEARAHSSRVSVNWKTYTKDSNLKWTSDAVEVVRMKDDISAASRTIAGLNGCRSQASPGQLATIDRMIPVLEEMVESATNAVDYLKRNQTRLSAKEYREYLDANSDTSSRLADIVGKLVDFGNSREKFERTKRTLAAK